MQQGDEPPNKKPRLDSYGQDPMIAGIGMNLGLGGQFASFPGAIPPPAMGFGQAPMQPIRANRGLVVEHVLRAFMEEAIKKQEKNVRIQNNAVDYMCQALEERMQQVIEEVVRLSHQRIDLSKETSTYEISANPKKIITDIQAKEKEENARLEQQGGASRSVDMKDLNKTKEQKDIEVANSSALAQIGNINRRPLIPPPKHEDIVRYNTLKLKLQTGSLLETERAELLQLHQSLDTYQKQVQQQPRQQPQLQPQPPIPQPIQPQTQPQMQFAEVKVPVVEIREHVVTKKDVVAFALHDPHLKAKLEVSKSLVGFPINPKIYER